MKTYLMAAATLLATPLALAQETTAAGTLNNQMSWTALNTRIESVSGKVTIMDIRVKTLEDELKKAKDCGNLGLMYGPLHAKADTKTGCVASTLPTSMYLSAQQRRYQPTGVYVKKGQKLTIKATGMASAGYEHVYYTADDRFSSGKGANSCMLLFSINSSKEFHADVYDYTGSWFCGKSSMSTTAASTGYLYAGVPEGASNSGDNQGGYMISVTVE